MPRRSPKCESPEHPPPLLRLGRGCRFDYLFVTADAKKTNRDHFGLAWSSSEGESEYVIDAISILVMKLALFSPLGETTMAYKSPSPSLYPAVVIFCNTGLRNAELRCALWSQVNFLKAEFEVGRAKTEGGTGRVIPLNQTALQAFKAWRARRPNAKPVDFIFPSEKLRFKGEGAADKGIMTPYDIDLTKPIGSWKKAWNTVKKQANVQCRIHDLRHHFISALAQTQTPDATIQAISGHLSRKMLDHYSHVRVDAKRLAVESLNSGTKQVQ